MREDTLYVFNRDELTTELRKAFAEPLDTYITAMPAKTEIHIKGMDSVLQEIQDVGDQIEERYSWKRMSIKQRNDLVAKDPDMKRLRIRLNNPERIINRFKKSAAKLWS